MYHLLMVPSCPCHSNVWDAVKHEGFRGLSEADSFIETLGILLSFNIYDLGIEVLYGSIDGMDHYLLAIAFTAYGRDDTTDGDLRHVSAGRTYASQGYHLAAQRLPQMNGCLVIVVKILIDAILLHYKHLAAYPQEFVEFRGCELRE